MAVATPFFKSLYSTYHDRIMDFDAFARALVSIQVLFLIPESSEIIFTGCFIQHWTFYLLMGIARINLYIQTVIFLLTRDRGSQVLVQLPYLVQIEGLVGPTWCCSQAWQWATLFGFWLWFSCLLTTLPSAAERIGYVVTVAAKSLTCHTAASDLQLSGM